MDKVRILAIETSSPRLSLAAGTESAVLKEYQGPLEWRHAESLFDGMQKLLAQVRWPVQSLTGIAVSIGPGSFTGIRIGLAAARAFGQALNIPVAGISSLPTIAQGLLKPGSLVCPLIDALRGDVFTGLYQMDNRGRVKRLWKESRLPLEVLLGKLKNFSREPLQLAGDAAILHKEALKRAGKGRWRFAAEVEGYPRAGHLLMLAAARLFSGRGSYQQVVPLYLRSASAVERRKR